MLEKKNNKKNTRPTEQSRPPRGGDSVIDRLDEQLQLQRSLCRERAARLVSRTSFLIFYYNLKRD
jgi:hypothetical protein